MTVPMQEAHLRRWQVASAFLLNVVAIVVVAILLSHAVHQNHLALTRLNQDKASISSLERSNCRLKTFLLSAAKFRRRIAVDATGAKRAADLKAARVSEKLARSESNERCPG